MKWFEDRKRNSLRHYRDPSLVLVVILNVILYFLFSFAITLHWIYG